MNAKSKVLVLVRRRVEKEKKEELKPTEELPEDWKPERIDRRWMAQ